MTIANVVKTLMCLAVVVENGEGLLEIPVDN